MNYRHAYHAGNFADVFKHAALLLLIQSLQKKDKGFACLDTHAGIGLYDLLGVEAGKTGEWQRGIAPVMAAAGPMLAPLVAAIRAVNEGDELRHYPGSPALVRWMARRQDRLELFELHPADAETLAALYQGDRQVSVRAADGYSASLKRLPPVERRGLVLVDPPYERTDEFPTLMDWLAQAHRLWATGCFMLWYPVKSRGEVGRFVQAVTGLGLPKTLRAEFTLGSAPGLDGSFHGSGLLLVNPPWQLDEQLAALGAELAEALGLEEAVTRVEWLVDEVGKVL